ncbi:hypothetical protein KWI08_05235 [Morganella morganii]|nr:hypothetical protein [Morganella morganii]
MMELIIKAISPRRMSGRCFFMGSRATLKAALKHNHCVLGMETERFEQTKNEIALL